MNDGECLPPRIPDSIGRYEFKGDLGSGAFSVVKLALNIEDRQYYACKVILRELLRKQNIEKKFENEIRILQQLHHPGIVELADLIKDDNYYYIVLEVCSNGELFEYIIENRRLKEQEAKEIMQQILHALDYIHDKGIAHRDLKPENILFDHYHRVKLTDFGLSRCAPSDNLVSTQCGSPIYASPELLSGEPYDPILSDNWACGVICYIIVTGQLPWTRDENTVALINQIKDGDYHTPPYLSDNCRNFICRYMDTNPETRMTVKQGLQHPWLRGLSQPRMTARSSSYRITNNDIDEFLDVALDDDQHGSILARTISNECLHEIVQPTTKVNQPIKAVHPPTRPPVNSSRRLQKVKNAQSYQPGEHKKNMRMSESLRSKPVLVIPPLYRRRAFH